MKGMNLLIWMTQLGLSLVIPLTSLSLLGLWLHYSLGWGRWALAAGIVLGIISGIQSLWNAVQIMTRTKNSGEENHPQSFNDHV